MLVQFYKIEKMKIFGVGIVKNECNHFGEQGL